MYPLMNHSTDKHTLELCQQEEHSLEKSGKALHIYWWQQCINRQKSLINKFYSKNYSSRNHVRESSNANKADRKASLENYDASTSINHSNCIFTCWLIKVCGVKTVDFDSHWGVIVHWGTSRDQTYGKYQNYQYLGRCLQFWVFLFVVGYT